MRADCFSSEVVAPVNGHLPSQLCHVRKRLVTHLLGAGRRVVHETLTREAVPREFVGERFRGGGEKSTIMIYVTSFGFRNGVPPDSDLVFDVRFLPNPNYIPKFKHLSGRNPAVAPRRFNPRAARDTANWRTLSHKGSLVRHCGRPAGRLAAVGL